MLPSREARNKESRIKNLSHAHHKQARDTNKSQRKPAADARSQLQRYVGNLFSAWIVVSVVRGSSVDAERRSGLTRCPGNPEKMSKAHLRATTSKAPLLGTNSNMACNLEMKVPFNTKSFVAPEPLVNVGFMDVRLMATCLSDGNVAESWIRAAEHGLRLRLNSPSHLLLTHTPLAMSGKALQKLSSSVHLRSGTACSDLAHINLPSNAGNAKGIHETAPWDRDSAARVACLQIGKCHTFGGGRPARSSS